MKKTIVFIHGMFQHPKSWEKCGIRAGPDRKTGTQSGKAQLFFKINHQNTLGKEILSDSPKKALRRFESHEGLFS